MFQSGVDERISGSRPIRAPEVVQDGPKEVTNWHPRDPQNGCFGTYQKVVFDRETYQMGYIPIGPNGGQIGVPGRTATSQGRRHHVDVFMEDSKESMDWGGSRETPAGVQMGVNSGVPKYPKWVKYRGDTEIHQFRRYEMGAYGPGESHATALRNG